ncbi:MAG: CinA family protein [Hyphomicrobium sp.]
MISDELVKLAFSFVNLARQCGLKVATAESCTGGLLSGALTEIPGSSEIFECGFITYSNEAKTNMLGVDPNLLSHYGAVSQEVAIAMAEGALAHSRANISVAITGIAGPTGATLSKPIGLVHFAVAKVGQNTLPEVVHFEDIGRNRVREAAVKKAISLLIERINQNK